VLERVLIVDDHAAFRRVARGVLVDGGFVVVGEAADAASALVAVRELQPDCVLLDVQLGDADGFEIARALDRQGGGPAVVLTSARDPIAIQPLVEAGSARGFIPKDHLTASALRELLR
jgi:DNA-binding NarL/FixJ family response regulator